MGGWASHDSSIGASRGSPPAAVGAAGGRTAEGGNGAAMENENDEAASEPDADDMSGCHDTDAALPLPMLPPPLAPGDASVSTPGGLAGGIGRGPMPPMLPLPPPMPLLPKAGSAPEP